MEARINSQAVKGKVKLKIKINGETYIVYGFANESSDYIALEVEYVKPAEND